MKISTYINKFPQTLTLITLCALTLFSCHTDVGKKTIRVAHNLDMKHPVHEALVFLAEDLEKRSNRSMEIKIFINQNLKNRKQAFEMLQAGSLGMTSVPVDIIENYLSKMKIFQLPYLFKDKTHNYNILNGVIGEELLNGDEKYWFKGLGYYSTGSRNFYTKEKPIETPEDLKGLKINLVKNNSSSHFIDKIGGTTRVIPKQRVHEFLEDNIIDGSEGSLITFYTSNHHEICKFYTLNEHSFSPEVIAVGQALWQSLDNQQKKWLQESVRLSIEHQQALLLKREKEILSIMKQKGVRIIEVNKNEFQDLAQVNYSHQIQDPETLNLIERIQATSND